MFLILLVPLVVAFINVEAAEISCEKFNRIGTLKVCCILNVTSAINLSNVTIAGLENSKVDAILLDYNKNVHFLPVSIYKKFPNLETYLAKNASIKEISVLNFDRLSSLQHLDLRANQIEFVPNYCFEGLAKLRDIFLGNVFIIYSYEY